MNLEALRNFKFDANALKNFSIQDVRNFINEQKVLALNIVIGLSTAIVIGFLLHMRLQEYATLGDRLAELVVKEEPSHKYGKLLKDTRNFLDNIPSVLPEEKVIPYLMEVAGRHHIVINELQPPYARIEGFYRELRIVFSCSVGDFHKALLFLNDLEISGYMVKVNSWSVDPQKTGQETLDPRINQGLLMKLDISSMQLIENDKKNQKKK